MNGELTPQAVVAACEVLLPLAEDFASRPGVDWGGDVPVWLRMILDLARKDLQ